jgi:PAS domain S-box-containing protein
MQGNKETVLIVDDDSRSIAVLTSMLTETGYQVRSAESGDMALASVAVAVPELILLDVHMPDMDGFEVCRRLKAKETSRKVPIILMNESADTLERIQGFGLGADDYITRPFEGTELLARVQTHLELARLHSQMQRHLSDRTRDLLGTVAQLKRDLAERKRTRQALAESEGRFRSLVDTAPAMIVVSDANQQATFFNKGWLDFTGRTLEQELGQGWSVSLHPEDRDRCLASISSSYASRSDCNVEYRLRRADGEYRWVVCRGVPRFAPDGTFAGYVGSLIDTTELKRMQDEALAAQKLESLGVLAGGIAHDFNNLLSNILTDSELLLSDLDQNSPARAGLERIEAVAVHAAEIVRQLMVYAGDQDTVFVEVDLAALVREMLELLKVSISREAVLKVNLAENLPLIRANSAQIRQVVLNLIMNASDALQGSIGVISVDLSRVQLSEQTSEDVTTLAGNDCLKVEITDTGSGMTDEIRARIFEPFFTTKSVGRGLGLAAVQGIIRGHGGTISVSSTPGCGSCFAILLPCERETVPADVETASSAR